MTSSPGHPSAAADPRLGTAECWTLLEGAELGRLALADADGVPDVFPVNIVAHEGSVYLRSARDSKLAGIAARPAAALEVDGEDETTLWSVVLRGTAVQVRDEQEIHRSGVLGVVSPNPRHKPFVIKVTPRSVTGRRFPKAPKPAPPTAATKAAPTAPPEPDAAPPAITPSEPQSYADHHPRHPDPIPHLPPITEQLTKPPQAPPGWTDPDADAD